MLSPSSEKSYSSLIELRPTTASVLSACLTLTFNPSGLKPFVMLTLSNVVDSGSVSISTPVKPITYTLYSAEASP